MKKIRITKSYVDTIKLPPVSASGKATQAFYRDASIPGFGLRVTSGGAKSFIIEKRIKGRVKRVTIGRYGNLTVPQARKEAMKLLGEVAIGKDPQAERRSEHAKGTTLQEAFDDYILSRKDLKASTVHDYHRSIEKSLSNWLSKPLTEITKDMVELRHRELGDKSHARANNTMRVLRAIFNHAIGKYEDAEGNPILTVNPTDRIKQTRGWYKVVRRETLIKPHQLKSWYQATLKLNNEVTRDYLHFLLFTGLRRSEAARLAWEHVDFGDSTLTFPDTKNGLTHVLPMSDFLLELFKRRKKACSHEKTPYVFPSPTERGYLVEPRTAVERVAGLSGVPFTLHDLRRTFITIAESLDIPAYALKRLLNHKDPNDVTAGYIINNVDRLRGPMQLVTDFIKNHSGMDEGADIVPINSAAREYKEA